MKLNGSIRLYLALLAVCSLAACEVKRPKVVMSNEKMEAVLYDYHLARAVGEVLGQNENYKSALFIEDAFRKHDITQADFDTTLAWLSRNPKHFTEIYERVNERLRARRDGINALIAMNEEKPMDTFPGDSIDVWMWQQHYVLSGLPLDNRISFVLPSDTNFYSRDTLRWNVRFRFEKGILPDSLHRPLMAMQVSYDTDTVISTWQHIDTEGERTLTLFADTLGNIKEVRGFVYLPQQPAVRKLLADRISLMRYHALDSLVFATDTLKNEEVAPARKTLQLKASKDVKPISSKALKVAD